MNIAENLVKLREKGVLMNIAENLVKLREKKGVAQ